MACLSVCLSIYLFVGRTKTPAHRYAYGERAGSAASAPGEKKKIVVKLKRVETNLYRKLHSPQSRRCYVIVRRIYRFGVREVNQCTGRVCPVLKEEEEFDL